jgi:hypothetical protein
LALGIAAALAIFLYRRDQNLVSPVMGRALSGLRLAVVLALVFLLAEPVLVKKESVRELGEVLLGIDASRSFSLSDPYRPPAQIESEASALGLEPGEVRGLSRLDLTLRALKSGWLEELRSRFRVSAFSFSSDSRPLPEPQPGEASSAFFDALSAAATSGGSTDLGRPLIEEIARRASEPPVGVILFTDGNHHAADDPREEARSLSASRVPWITIGVGALEAPPDLALEAVDATGKVFAEDEVKAQITVAASGFPALDIPIRISAGEKAVKEIVASLPAGPAATRIPVSFPAGAPGRKKLTFSFPEVKGEVTPLNNSRDLWLEVLSEKARVLLLDGAPRWEERYLRAAWSREKSVELHDFLVTPPPDRRLPSGFPRGREELFAYDVVLLGDVEPAVFAREEIHQLADFVTARGGTLIILSGERAMPYEWAGTTLAEVLPVNLLDPAPRAGLGTAATGDGLPLTLTPAGQLSEITRLVPGRERNAELWELLPKPLWLSPTAGVKPGAQVLVSSAAGSASRLPDERGAVVVTRSFGLGQVLYTGIDSSWRWRYRFGDELYRRFWGQVVRWAVSKRLGAEDGHVRLGTDKLLYEPGANVKVEALIEEAPGRPFEGRLVDAVITRAADGAQKRCRLEPIPKSSGRYEGVWATRFGALDDIGLTPSGQAASEYEVRLDLPEIPGYSQKADRAKAVFAVEPEPDLEKFDLALNTKLLADLAKITGGRFLPFARFREAIALLPDRASAREKITEVGWQDHPLAIALALLSLLSLEWILRKRRDLV